MLLDVAGNVWEWTASAYKRKLDRETSCVAFGTERRVLRGGGYVSPAASCRVSARSHFSPAGEYDRYCFRLARAIPF